MNQDASRTLLYPFEAGALDLPEKTDRALFLGAEPGFRLPDGWAAPIHAVQGFRPDFRALERMGVAVTPRAEEQGYGVALVLALEALAAGLIEHVEGAFEIADLKVGHAEVVEHPAEVRAAADAAPALGGAREDSNSARRVATAGMS